MKLNVRKLDVRKLEKRTRILIKTPDEVYELEVGTPKLSVVLVGSDRRFESRDKAVLVGSLICEGARLRLHTSHNGIIYTGPVVYAKISGESYEYVLWG